MKKAFTRWYNYLIALGLCLVIACIAIIPYFALNDASKWPISFISYTFLFSGVVVFGIGFIIQDVYRARIRHKTKNWNNPLDEDKLDNAWAILMPALVAALTSVAVGIICSLILK